MADIHFLLCGRYVYSVDRSVPQGTIQWPVPVQVPLPPPPIDDTSHANYEPETIRHSIVLEDDMCYIHGSHMWRIDRQRNDGLVYLESKLIDDATTTSRQMVGVVPDNFITKYNDLVLLVWPADPTKEVKLIVMSIGGQAAPLMIKTGILGEALSIENVDQNTS